MCFYCFDRFCVWTLFFSVCPVVLLKYRRCSAPAVEENPCASEGVKTNHTDPWPVTLRSVLTRVELLHVISVNSDRGSPVSLPAHNARQQSSRGRRCVRHLSRRESVSCILVSMNSVCSRGKPHGLLMIYVFIAWILVCTNTGAAAMLTLQWLWPQTHTCYQFVCTCTTLTLGSVLFSGRG